MEKLAENVVMIKTFKINHHRTPCVVIVAKEEYETAINNKWDIIVDTELNITFYNAEEPNKFMRFIDGEIFEMV